MNVSLCNVYDIDAFIVDLMLTIIIVVAFFPLGVIQGHKHHLLNSCMFCQCNVWPYLEALCSK